MQIHFIRNATLIIHAGKHHILVDPMLGAKGTLPPYAFLRQRTQLNPTVPLPPNTEQALQTVTAGLLTHCRRLHYDHLDPAGWNFLSQQAIPLYCNHLDVPYLRRRGIDTNPLKPDTRHDFLGGKIMPFETAHGYGFVGKLMGPGLGYFIESPGEPSLYISGDTVLIPIVKHILAELKPDIAILAAGVASLDIGRPILMPMEEILEFVRLAPGRVVATHMEALNHCPISRKSLREKLVLSGLDHKVLIPNDGDLLSI